MRLLGIQIILFACLLFALLMKPVYAGQDEVDISKETKQSINTKLDVCLKSNVINISNYKNLQVLYANLLSEKKIIEEKLKTLEESQKENEGNEIKKLEKEKQKATEEAQNYKKTAKNILYLLIGALIAFGLNRYFSTKAKYYLVAERYSSARFYGILSFIFLGISIISTILFLYFLLTLVF